MKLRPWVSLLGFVAFSGGGFAYAVPSGFELSDDVAGATCAYYSGMGRMAWTRRGGDWADAKGSAHGAMAFDTQTIRAGPGRVLAQWSVSELVRGWLRGTYRNDGLLLRVEKEKSSGVIDFHSRDSEDSAARPTLVLEWSDGSTDRLLPKADTHLDCSTHKSQGSQKILKLSVDQNALLRFSLPEKNPQLEHAFLLLGSDKQYGSGANIGVFRAAPPYERTPSDRAPGIAASFPRDAGIEKHPGVIFAANFESPLWAMQWSPSRPGSRVETVSADTARQFKPFQGRALRVGLVKGRNDGLNLRYLFAKSGQQEPEEIHFRYYLRFGDDWNPYLDGGKLPGIAGTYDRGGWGLRKSDGYNGWSTRGAFSARPAAAASVSGLTAIGSYVYHADGQENSGDYWSWDEGPAGLLENNKWYAIEQYVKLNSPGNKDGVFRAWIDGRQVLEKTGLSFRHVPDLKIESVWLNVYHGGSSPAPQDMTLYIDNVVIAKSYIGPVKP